MVTAGGGPGGGHRLRALFPQESSEYWFHGLMVVVSALRRERVVVGRLANKGSVSRAGVRPGGSEAGEAASPAAQSIPAR